MIPAKDAQAVRDMNTLSTGQILTHIDTTPDQATAARRYLQRHGALDVAEMLGVAG